MEINNWSLYVLYVIEIIKLLNVTFDLGLNNFQIICLRFPTGECGIIIKNNKNNHQSFYRMKYTLFYRYLYIQHIIFTFEFELISLVF